MTDSSEAGSSESFSWQLVRQNMGSSRQPDAWWLGEGDGYHLAQEAKGLVIAQMAEVEAVLLRIVALAFSIAGDTHALARQRLLERRPARQLLEDVGIALRKKPESGTYESQLKRLGEALDRRNALAHGALEMRGAGEYESSDGRFEWREGEAYLDGEACGPDRLRSDLRDAVNATVAAIEILNHFEQSTVQP
jgi:hypothetical protein